MLPPARELAGTSALTAAFTAPVPLEHQLLSPNAPRGGFGENFSRAVNDPQLGESRSPPTGVGASHPAVLSFRCRGLSFSGRFPNGGPGAVLGGLGAGRAPSTKHWAPGGWRGRPRRGARRPAAGGLPRQAEQSREERATRVSGLRERSLCHSWLCRPPGMRKRMEEGRKEASAM